jgi:two-component SAPR family response regulator
MELYDAGGRLITWRTKKAKELFAYLWHHGGSPVYRYKFIDQLWPDTPPERAQALFHTTLYNLRSALKAAGHPDMVAFGDERYWMRTTHVASDLASLEAVMKREGGPGDAEKLLELYRGDYLETEHYDWAASRKADIRGAFLSCLEQWAEQASGLEKERLLRKLIELDPYREHYYDRLLRHLIDRGDLAAVDKVERLKQLAFGQDLGLEPR